jgi:5-methylcytosine-specific restriction endonuclease McrA
MGIMLLTSRIENFTRCKDSTPVLFLSSGYEPMYRTHWKRAISAVFCGRAEIVEEHAIFKIFTSSGPIPFPTIVRYTNGIIIGKLRKIPTSPKVTKRNVWLRDNGRCQYCEKFIALSDATVDHVFPKSRGGKNTWENVTLACSKCNQKKGSRLLENTSLKISRPPFKPRMDSLFLK